MKLLGEYTKEDIIHFSEVKKPFFLTLILFFLFAIFGYFVAGTHSAVVDELLDALEGVVESIIDLSLFDTALFIFFNNAYISFFASLGGIFFAFLSFMIVLSNGFVFGIVLNLVLEAESLKFFMLGILPHGIFELPIVLFSIAIGFWLGRSLFDYVFMKRIKKEELYKKIRRALYTYVVIILPVLFLAAFVESYITAFILKNFL